MNELSPGDWIRHKRMVLGWTQEQLAEKFHCKPNTIALWERGINAPSLFGAIQAALLWFEYQQKRKILDQTDTEILEKVPVEIFSETILNLEK